MTGDLVAQGMMSRFEKSPADSEGSLFPVDGFSGKGQPCGVGKRNVSRHVQAFSSRPRHPLSPRF
jgi:hypothetical protein